MAANFVQTILNCSAWNVIFEFLLQISAIQANPTDIVVKTTEPPSRIELHCDFHVKGITTTANHICVWSGKKVATYEVGPSVNTDYKLVGEIRNKLGGMINFSTTIFKHNGHHFDRNVWKQMHHNMHPRPQPFPFGDQ